MSKVACSWTALSRRTRPLMMVFRKLKGKGLSVSLVRPRDFKEIFFLGESYPIVLGGTYSYNLQGSILRVPSLSTSRVTTKVD